VLDRESDGYLPHTHLASDLTYVRVLSAWHYICLLVDLANREIVGHAAGARKGAKLVKSAFATVVRSDSSHARFTSALSSAHGSSGSPLASQL